MKRVFFYGGVLFICASVTGLQIMQTRLLSVTSFYYLAFLSISMAMFGMTAGAVWVYDHAKELTRETLPQDLASFASRFCISIAACLLLQLCHPLVQVGSAMMVVLWAGLALVLAIPFFFAGVVVSLALTRSEFPVGEVYAVDLIGAALGCLGALGLLHVLDAPSAILAVGAVAAFGASLFGRSGGTPRPPAGSLIAAVAARPGLIALLLLAAAVANAGTIRGLQPIVVKGEVDTRADVEYEKWNSYSRVYVGHRVDGAPALWGPSDRMPAQIRVSQRPLNIDGLAVTTMFGAAAGAADPSFLKYDVTNAAYSIRDTGRAAIIGVGGGRDVLSAWSFGFRDITGVELNPIFIDLLTNREPFAAFAGLSGRPGIKFRVDEARSWFASTNERFDLIQMSMIDTWAATGAGAYSFSENGLYTVEGWRRFIDALTPTGVFTVSRWYGAGAIDESGRMVSLATRVLLDFGVAEPERHLAVVANRNLATLILAREPLSAAELARLHRLAGDMNFQMILAPDKPPATPLLGRIAQARDPTQLASAIAGLPFDLSPPRDDRPFFFNQLPLTEILRNGFDLKRGDASIGVTAGNLQASIALVIILAVALALVAIVIVVPLQSALRDTGWRLALGGSGYFLLLGIGFMFVEIALLQRFSLFLGHPVYSLSVVLFAIILSTGLGSLLSERVRLGSLRQFAVWAVLLAGYVASLPAWLPEVVAALESAGILARGAVSAAIIAPAGLLMGFGFPAGMRIVLQQEPKPAPWFWGINGAAGVLGSILAVAVGITYGINASFSCGAVCYAALIPAVALLRSKASMAQPVATARETG